MSASEAAVFPSQAIIEKYVTAAIQSYGIGMGA
jgi:hypothetical protein